MTFITIDADGFKAGTICPSEVCEFNKAVVVKTLPPDIPLAPLERWRWVANQWVAVLDFRGHSWYNPIKTKEVHHPTSFDDAPPDGWVYWAPGENKAISLEDLIANRWGDIRTIRDGLLDESDWVVARAVDLGLPVPSDWQAYRQELRDITLQPDPRFLVWPTPPG